MKTMNKTIIGMAITVTLLLNFLINIHVSDLPYCDKHHCSIYAR